ncbi:MAG: hypothetical protein D6773_10570, partial [Alphaproteobacteria bacterium]
MDTAPWKTGVEGRRQFTVYRKGARCHSSPVESGIEGRNPAGRTRTRQPMHILLRGTTTQRLRLASGLILFAFALTHFLNHALGLVSIDAMHGFQEVRLAVTRSLAGGIILGLALIIHVGLALGKLGRRTTFRIPPWELTQIFLGLAIPFFLAPHIANTRLASTLFGVNDIYFYELLRLWPGKAW